MKQRISTAEHDRVLSCCSDVPGEVPSFQIALAEVGISAKTAWVNLPQGCLPFTVEMSVDLPAHRRGIHMSRLEEAMVELYEAKFDDLGKYAVELGRLMVNRQEALRGAVMVSGALPVLRQTSTSGRTSLDSIDISAQGLFFREEDRITSEVMVGAGLHHMTACPCTQVYNQVLFEQQYGLCPLPTHSQRSYTKLELSAGRSGPVHEELVACLEASLHVTQDLLKRPDEAEIVLKAHRHPQFAEDAVRETAREVGKRFGDILPRTTRVKIESVSLESIHIHDVRCRLDSTLAEIVASLTNADTQTP